MPRTCIIHVGMMKTGSSSIQETVSRLTLEKYKYLRMGLSPNHSGAMETLLSANPAETHANKKRGFTSDQVAEQRKRFREILFQELDKDRKKSLIISAEYLSGANIDAIQALKDIVNGYCDQFRIICYVRPPVSYMQSLFQQWIKSRVASRLSIENLYPNYKEMIEKFDEVFGPEHVELYKFSPESLFGGDVVKDFGHRLGIEINDEAVVRVNESLSLEATAILFAYRKFGGEAWKDPFINIFRGIGERRVRFSSDLVDPVLKNNSNDIAWIEQRLGEQLLDCGDASPDAITSEEDLLNLAAQQEDTVLALLKPHIVRDAAGVRRVALLADELACRMSQPSMLPDEPKASSQIWFTDEQLSRLEKETLSATVVMRDLALALHRSGKTKAAASVVKQGLAVNPDSEALKKLQARLNLRMKN